MRFSIDIILNTVYNKRELKKERSKSMGIECTCEECGKVFQVPTSDHRFKVGKKIRFCSQKCYWEHKRGSNIVKGGEKVLIHSFMINELELKGAELLIYAVIYSEQQENRCYDKTLRYLANWTGCTIQGVIKALKSLQNKGFIKREEVFYNNVKKIEYWCV